MTSDNDKLNLSAPSDLASRDIYRRQLLKGAASLVGGASLLPLISACGGAGGSSAPNSLTVASTWKGLVAAAKKEGTCTFYNANADLSDPIQAAFSKQYPWAIVNCYNGGGTDLISKSLIEARAGIHLADVNQDNIGNLSTLKKAGLLTSFSVPNDKLTPSTVKGPATYYHAVYLVVIIYEYNKNLSGPLPRDPYELISPAWKGKLVMDAPADEGTTTSFMASRKSTWSNSKWETWLAGLEANDVLWTSSGGAAYSAILAGQRAAGIGSNNDLTSQKAGAPVEAGVYDDFLTLPQYACIYKDAPHPNMARLFVDWLLSPTGGQKVYAATGRTPAAPISGLTGLVSLSNILALGNPHPTQLNGYNEEVNLAENLNAYLATFKKYYGVNG